MRRLQTTTKRSWRLHEQAVVSHQEPDTEDHQHEQQVHGFLRLSHIAPSDLADQNVIAPPVEHRQSMLPSSRLGCSLVARLFLVVSLFSTTRKVTERAEYRHVVPRAGLSGSPRASPIRCSATTSNRQLKSTARQIEASMPNTLWRTSLKAVSAK
jgi:hypothetical protein